MVSVPEISHFVGIRREHRSRGQEKPMPKDERAGKSQFHWVGIIVWSTKVVEGNSRR
jgi:hypothetical protein